MKGTFAHQILMIRPAHFGYNQETASNNAFQTEAKPEDVSSIATTAVAEFDAMVAMLRDEGVQVYVWQDTDEPVKPDAVFPNNWFSTTPDGRLITYPMYAENRRTERSEEILDWLDGEVGLGRRYALEHYESKEQYLESTGSILFDHDHKVMFACLSVRTDLALLQKLAVLIGYQVVWFDAVDADGMPIYHTNVMMCLGAGFAVVCMESIRDAQQQTALSAAIEQTGRLVIPINYDQMASYAGNMIQLQRDNGYPLLVMSAQAEASLTKEQRDVLSTMTDIVAPDIQTIETYGGGSARCMIAELFVAG